MDGVVYSVSDQKRHYMVMSRGVGFETILLVHENRPTEAQMICTSFAFRPEQWKIVDRVACDFATALTIAYVIVEATGQLLR